MKRITFTEFFGLVLKQCAVEADDPKQCWLSEKPSELHRIIQELAAEYSTVLPPLASLYFAKQGVFPYSREISRTLDLLQQSGMIRRENPSFDRFAPTWHEDTAEVCNKRKEEIFSDDIGAEETFLAFSRDLCRRLQTGSV